MKLLHYFNSKVIVFQKLIASSFSQTKRYQYLLWYHCTRKYIAVEAKYSQWVKHYNGNSWILLRGKFIKILANSLHITLIAIEITPHVGMCGWFLDLHTCIAINIYNHKLYNLCYNVVTYVRTYLAMWRAMLGNIHSSNH